MNILNLFKGGGETLSGDEQDALALIELDELRAQDRENKAKLARLQAELDGNLAASAKAALAELEKRPKATTPEEVAEALVQERKRLVAISKLAMDHDASAELLDKAIHSGMSVDAFAVALLGEKKKDSIRNLPRKVECDD